MKVLVTGATGFIGFYVIEKLLKQSVSVIATSTDVGKARKKSWFDKVQFIEHKIGEEEKYENLYRKFQEPDAVIHLAWKGLPNYKALFHFEEHLFQQYFFLKNLVAHGLQNLLVTGTCFEYGMKNGCLSEEMSSDPANPYALSKDTLRKFLEQLQQTVPYALKWVRLFYMYGDGQNPNSLLAQLQAALDRGDEVFNMSEGNQVRDYLSVKEVAENIIAISMQQDIHGIINCCSGNPVTVKALVMGYIEKSGKSINLNCGYYPYPDYEPMEFWGSREKLKTILENTI